MCRTGWYGSEVSRGLSRPYTSSRKANVCLTWLILWDNIPRLLWDSKRGEEMALPKVHHAHLAHSWVLWFRPRPTCVVTLQQNTRSQSVSAGSFDQLCLDNKMSTSFWILHSNLVLQKASQLWELLLNTSNRVKACGQVLLSVWNGEWWFTLRLLKGWELSSHVSTAGMQGQATLSTNTLVVDWSVWSLSYQHSHHSIALQIAPNHRFFRL